MVGAAAGATGAAIYFETERQAARSDATDAETRHEYDTAQADYDHARVAELVSVGAAVGLLGLGVTLLVLDTRSGNSLALAVGMDPAAETPFGGSARLTGSF